jgi:DNA primase
MRIEKTYLLEKVSMINILEMYNISYKKIGKNYMALCPFHNDHHASLQIYKDKKTGRQKYCCFSCQSKGDIFTFVREYEKVLGRPEPNFIQTMKIIADYFKIDGAELLKGQETSEMLEGQKKAASGSALLGFHQLFSYYRNSNEAQMEFARIFPELLDLEKSFDMFEIGYCPDNVKVLEQFQKAKKIDLQECLQSKLFLNKDNKITSSYLGRMIFPLKDSNNNLICFIGRSIREDAPANYVFPQKNSAGKTCDFLFGLDQVRKNNPSEIILTNNVMDVIVGNSMGFNTMISSIKRTLTDQQRTTLVELCPNKITFLLERNGYEPESVLNEIRFFKKNGIRTEVLDLNRLKRPEKPQNLLEAAKSNVTKEEMEASKISGMEYYFQNTLCKDLKDPETISLKFEKLQKEGMIQDQRDAYCFYETASNVLGKEVSEMKQLCDFKQSKMEVKLSKETVLEWFKKEGAQKSLTAGQQESLLKELKELCSNEYNQKKECLMAKDM